jgi:hypothetical protein
MNESIEKPDPEELLTLLLIQSMRNYDVLIHLLKHFDEETAKQLVEMHENLEQWGPLPFKLENEVD